MLTNKTISMPKSPHVKERAFFETRGDVTMLKMPHAKDLACLAQDRC